MWNFFWNPGYKQFWFVCHRWKNSFDHVLIKAIQYLIRYLQKTPSVNFAFLNNNQLKFGYILELNFFTEPLSCNLDASETFWNWMEMVPNTNTLSKIVYGLDFCFEFTNMIERGKIQTFKPNFQDPDVPLRGFYLLTIGQPIQQIYSLCYGSAYYYVCTHLSMLYRYMYVMYSLNCDHWSNATSSSKMGEKRPFFVCNKKFIFRIISKQINILRKNIWHFISIYAILFLRVAIPPVMQIGIRFWFYIFLV